MRKRRLATGMLCAAMCLACVSPAGAAEAVEAPVVQAQGEGDEGISPQSEEIVWVIKTINGKKYRRLYNTTTGEFIGNWIPCS